VQTIIQRFNGDGMNFAIVLSVFNGLPKTHLVSSMQHLNRSFKGLTTPGSLSKMQSEKDSQAAPGGFRISAMVSDLPSPIRVLSVADEPVLLSTRQRILELENFVVHSLADASKIPSGIEIHGPFDVVILGHTLDVAQIKTAVVWLRSHQPSTKILLLGTDARGLEPSQFDELMNPADGPSSFLAAVTRITKRSSDQTS
jgi:hypothetical protein